MFSIHDDDLTPALYPISDLPTFPNVNKEKASAQPGTWVPDPSTSGTLDDSPADREVGDFQAWEEGMGEEGDEAGTTEDVSSAPQQDVAMRVEVTVERDDRRERTIAQDANDHVSAPGK